MPRATQEKTSPVTFRIDMSDLNRIYDLYQVPGAHGRIAPLIRTGIHLQIFIEEVERERFPTTKAVKQAIYTLRKALDKRDCSTNDTRTQPASSSASKETAEQARAK